MYLLFPLSPILFHISTSFLIRLSLACFAENFQSPTQTSNRLIEFEFRLEMRGYSSKDRR